MCEVLFIDNLSTRIMGKLVHDVHWGQACIWEV
jgi:hypothetical protein